jgi:hypothetical protein
LAETSTIWASPLAFRWVSWVGCDIGIPSTYWGLRPSTRLNHYGKV